MADVTLHTARKIMRSGCFGLRLLLLQGAFGVVGLAAVLASGTALAADPAKTSVADLRYGVVLYDYYQQDYLGALSELMVAASRDGIHGHSDNPQLIHAGISLAFGMENHAEQLFNNLLQDKTRPQSVRDAAWFYLGKLQYTRNQWEAAERSFARVSSAFNPALMAETKALQIHLGIHREQIIPVPLKRLSPDQLRSWSPYALYNLGAAYARSGDYEQAKTYFRALNELEMPEDIEARQESLALRDKAHTAMGYSFLLQKSYSPAIAEFLQVRLDGSQSNQALLGYGWAALEQQNYELAIKPWQLLRQRSLIYPAVQESLLALPFAYEKLGAEGEALAAYETAESLLTKEIEQVQEMRAQLTSDQLLAIIDHKPGTMADAKQNHFQLMAAVTDEGQNWLTLDRTSVIQTRSAYLIRLFAENEFQAAVLDLRDLMRLRHLLQGWLPKLEIYRDLLQEKQALRQRQEQQLAQQVLIEQQQRLQQQRDKLVARLTAIIAGSDAMALADEETRQLYERVKRSQSTLQQMAAAGEDSGDAAGRLRMYAGILQWRAAEAFPDHLWRNEKNRRVIDSALAELNARLARIGRISATGLDIRPMLARIDELDKNTRQQLAQTNQAIETRAEALRVKVDQQLAGHQQRLTAYLAQAHLSVARLYDAALRKAQ